MEQDLPRRVRAPLMGVLALQWLLAWLIGIGTLTCTGWDVAANNRGMLAFRLGGYLACSGGALLAGIKGKYLISSCLLVATGGSYVWLETGWLFTQPAFSQPSSLALLPFVIALVILLAPHSPTLRAQMEAEEAPA